MAIFDDTRHAAATSHAFHFVSVIFHKTTEFVDAFRNRRQVAKLLYWDAHMLRDIGLTPGDVHSAMAGSIGKDPSCQLESLAQERRRASQLLARERLDRHTG